MCRPLSPRWTRHNGSSQVMKEAIFPPESWKVTLTPVLGFVCSVRGCTVLLEWERVIFEMFLHFNMGWSQNILNIRVCVQFGTLFNEDESGSPILRDGSPYHLLRQVFGGSKRNLWNWKCCQHS